MVTGKAADVRHGFEPGAGRGGSHQCPSTVVHAWPPAKFWNMDHRNPNEIPTGFYRSVRRL